ncbi:dna gyrase subunit a : DNA gyrase subunit A OS=Pirellula staleyi (strain ATCC 27377 / DSM 6068 / ICPB 4128) GN=gyrA PE=3 SV=1: DNA_topoisoIV: DNA_gyraseA_C: DNA_gyraseA_C: DNA_gyraseA_C: DNA_gyraseA_C: DNA_gyraseA_C: DNA_gyraseA_C [Gemmataceae bacterium]|nr:dna gyrase subunit a : DNA gyrase subunit A OS=Pirellula staleyi (strain ATCC 27377 / DSM 6068 / ICPB 4128) GN=gyrA PE=3 SV=1: DNA_topoisoIV: DNA_gyraseA_C: DNA_gyraseA_C: DNA_gyraseA_C: DNA_gyraseA_C: DNA_gyraseA_C: DNA_gyraseA_C [Gemmataceae bacterium]VTU01222.1 dna gyrase subunit a : DNA gyrase subunit A OS=Pirellula staleyi (strain ATCC 27377 / DSM 6068 / ICPB 4128) GN=gyrA PE=3 SV=1: DNA_topoisoIV: DNA_gyraseA_C: DNA_gyraseA_C: DNA_gyraseA_C: DNA_gyraseA_C: DNA_gyraseA_C: DNA_gyraseA_C [Ge
MASRTPPPAPPDGTPALPPAPIDDLDIVDELQTSYRTYALSVIVSRALPDVRDGLKPSQRRILVAMNDLGLTPTAATSKCAGIIGETMKRYHPHGDASIYDSLVRMAQDWVLRYRLVHGQGNFGSIAGLPPAAHRYTEARLTAVANELLNDIDHETVDFIDNYDGKYREPLVLPAKFPNLLVNGSDGIAVGIATHIPPHNLKEVCLGLLKVLDNPDVSLMELLEVIPGPDFPTGGIVMGRQGVVEAYNTGYGKLTLRARTEVVEGKSPHILIKEVPFQVSRIPLLEEIGQLVKDERISGISAVRDESSARGGEPVRIVVELKRGTDPHMVLNQLYQFSKLQKTISINMWALTDGYPRRMPLKELMRKFLDHRQQVIRRRTEYLLREAKRRGHVLEGQLIAIANIEEVIRICRTSPNRTEAKLRLQGVSVPASMMERALGAEAFAALQRELGTTTEYQMTEAQAEAVVRLQLGQLANLESDEILKEYQALRDQIRDYETLLSDEANVRAVIRADLEQMAARYGDARKTEFSDDGGDVDMEDLIEDEPNVVTISHQQFIKRMPLTEYRVQNRGGKGVQGGVKDEDFVEHFFVASTKSYLLCFTNKGQLYWLKVYKIPTGNRTSAGRNIANVLQSLKEGEKITSIVPVREFVDGLNLLMATRKGTVKKTELMAYSNVRTNGIIGISLDDGDELIDVCLTKPGDEVVLSTRNGMAIRFSEADARAMGRNARGVKGIKLGKDDEIVGMVVADPDGLLLTVCENGYGKRTPFGANADPAALAAATGEANGDEPADAEAAPAEPAEGDEPADENDPSGMRYRLQRRGGKGVKDVKVTAKNGKVVSINSVRDGDEIMLITSQGMVTRSKVDDIRTVGRNTQGVRVMNLKDGDKLVTVAKVARDTVATDPAPDESGA